MKKLSISFASPTQSAMAEKVLTTKNQSALTIRVLSGSQAKQYCKDMTQIRLLVYKEFPYLYQGTFECEAEYLETYFKSPNATVLLVFDHDKVVGFSSSIPLAEEVDDLKEPFIKKGLDLKNYLYINEVRIS